MTKPRGCGEVPTGTAVTPPLEHNDAVSHAVFRADSKAVVTASDDGTVRIWNSNSGKPLAPPLQHAARRFVCGDEPRRKTHSNGGKRRSRARLEHVADRGGIAAASAYRFPGACVLQFRRQIRRHRQLGSDGPCVGQFNRQSDHSAIEIFRSGSVCDIQPGWTKRRCDQLYHQGAFVGCDDGKRIACRGLDQDRIRYASFSPDGKKIVTASNDKSARIWDAITGKPIGDAMQHDGAVVRAIFSPNGRLIATASSDNTARIWDAATGQAASPPLHHEFFVTSVAFSPDGKTLLTSSQDKTARLWEVSTGRPIATMQHDDAVWRAAFSKEGSRVVTASQDGTARIWDASSGKAILPMQHPEPVLDACFSPDGRLVATGCEDGNVRLWSAETGELLAPPFVHSLSVRNIEFSPDGKLLLSASWDKTARLWNVAPIDWPVEEIETFAELESSHRIGADGTIEALDAADVSKLIAQFNAAHRAP